VLKRYSFIGDGLSHVAFGAMSVAAVLHLFSNTILVMPVTIIVAVLLLKSGRNSMLKGDAAIAMLSVTSLAFGYMIMNVFSASANVSGDVCSTLFGSTSIMTLSNWNVILCIILSVVVVTFFILLYNYIFAITFDENFAKAVGTKVKILNFVTAIVIAVIIVLAMNLVGSLLVSALIIFPALSAMRIYNSFKSVTIFSAVFSVVCTLSGIILSILINTPVGATIVAVDMVGF
jgi:zinc transport system permease protein